MKRKNKKIAEPNTGRILGAHVEGRFIERGNMSLDEFANKVALTFLNYANNDVQSPEAVRLLNAESVGQRTKRRRHSAKLGGH